MDRLPLEVLFHILQYLNVKDRCNARLVCKTWAQLICSPAMWSDHEFSVDVFDETLKNWISRVAAKRLRTTIDLDSRMLVDSVISLTVHSDVYGEMQGVETDGPESRSKVVKSLLEGVDQLINLEELAIKQACTLNLYCMGAILAKTTKLKMLYLHDCYLVDYRLMSLLSDKPHLEKVYIYLCGNMELQTELPTLARMPRMKVLQVPFSGIGDSSLAWLLSAMPNLNCLDISSCDSLTDKALGVIAKSSVTMLAIRACYGFTIDGLQNFFREMGSQLQALDSGHMLDKDLDLYRTLFNTCPNLKLLNVRIYTIESNQLYDFFVSLPKTRYYTVYVKYAYCNLVAHDGDCDIKAPKWDPRVPTICPFPYV